MTQAEDENKDGVKQKPAKLRPLDAAELDAIGGEPLAGSGFEEEEPEPGFSDTETSGPAPDQNPG